MKLNIDKTALHWGLGTALSAITVIGCVMTTRTLLAPTGQNSGDRQNVGAQDVGARLNPRPGEEDSAVSRFTVRKASARTSFHAPDMIPIGRMDVTEQIAGLRDLQSHVYRRLEEYRTESDESERLLLCNEMAAGIRRALDLGTRCILDQCMKVPYTDARLSNRIDMCLPFLGKDAIDSLHLARKLCNSVLHGEAAVNTTARFTAAAKTPGLLIGFLKSIADESGMELENE